MFSHILMFSPFSYGENQVGETQTNKMTETEVKASSQEVVLPQMQESKNGNSNETILSELNRLSKEAEDKFSIASLIIDWSAMFFALLAILLVIAGAIGIREFSSIRALEKNLKDTYEKVQQELIEIKELRDGLFQKIEMVDKKLKEENQLLLRTTYLMNEGINSLRAGNSDQAIEKFKDVLKNSPDDYSTLCYLARAYGLTERFMPARMYAQKAVSVDGGKYFAYYILGEIYRMQKNYVHAIENLTKAVELAPLTKNFNGLGYAFMKSGNYIDAIDAFKESLFIEDRYSANSGIAKVYMLTNDLVNAERHFSRAKTLALKDIKRGMNNYGLSYFNAAFSFMFFGDAKSLDFLKDAIKQTQNKGVISEQLLDYEIFNEKNILSGYLLTESIKILKDKLDSLQIVDEEIA